MPIENQELEQLYAETNDISMISEKRATSPSPSSTRLVLAVAAAVSALAGGLAATWYYRRTLSRLQHAELEGSNSKFGMPYAADDEEL